MPGGNSRSDDVREGTGVSISDGIDQGADLRSQHNLGRYHSLKGAQTGVSR